MLVRSLTALALATAALSACVIQPYDYQVTNGPDAPFTVAGYTDHPQQYVKIDMAAYDYKAGYKWVNQGAVYSANTPSYSAGWFGYNAPALYYYSFTVQHPVWINGEMGKIRVTNATQGQVLYGGDADALGCFLGTANASSDFYGVGYDCGFTLTEINVDNGLIP